MTRDISGHNPGQIRDIRDINPVPARDTRDKPPYRGLSLSRVPGCYRTLQLWKFPFEYLRGLWVQLSAYALIAHPQPHLFPQFGMLQVKPQEASIKFRTADIIHSNLPSVFRRARRYAVLTQQQIVGGC
jgi:hypothetical protein